MSDVDPNVIRDDTKVSKADLREQLTIIKNEITALQNITALPRKMMYDDNAYDTL